MTEKNYYPEKVYNDQNPEKEIEVTVSMTLSKTVKIKVDDYKVLDSGNDEDGTYFENIDYSYCDLENAVQEQMFLPHEAGNLLRSLEVAEAELYSEELSDWNVDDFTVTLE